MASCSPFKVDFTGSAEDLFKKISKLIHQHGGTISGNDKKGDFSVPTPLGKVSGSYQVSGQQVTIHIKDRSFLLPCSAIESFVKSHIPSVVAADISEL